MKRVLLVCTMDPSVDPRFDRLRDLGFELVRRQDVRSEDALRKALDGAWAVIAGNEPYTDRVLASATGLRVIARPGVGYDNVDVDAATRRGIGVIITPGANHEAVGDLTLGLMLAVVRRIPHFDRLLRAGGWRADGLSLGLYGTTVGIVGLGLIGRAVVRRLSGFGCQIIATEPYPDRAFCREHGIELVELAELVRRADVVSLHVPLHGPTRHLIDRAALGLMKPTAVVINTSRGGVIDQAALVEALQAGRLAGAGLDVFETEPLPVDDPLRSLDSVVLTSHVAAHTTEAMVAMIDAAVDGIVAAAEGRAPDGCLNPAALAAGAPDAATVADGGG
jgi:phosphoglycerate dehydrogenase-like enzyme